MSSVSSASSEVEVVDEKKLNQMKLAILKAERRNLNTDELNNADMVDLLKKTITTFADKSF